MAHNPENWTAAPLYRGFYELERALNWLSERNFLHDVYVCGGWLRWACSPRFDPVPAGDIDFYCVDDETYKRLRWHLSRKLKRRASRENAVSVTYKRVKETDNEFFGLPPVQLIKPMDDGRVVTQGDIFEILGNFDFSIIRLGASIGNLGIFKTVTADIDFYQDELDKKIRIKNIHCPISSTYRVIKYARRGYWVNMPEIFKLFADWDGRDDEYRRELFTFFDRIADETMPEPTEEEILHIERLLRID